MVLLTIPIYGIILPSGRKFDLISRDPWTYVVFGAEKARRDVAQYVARDLDVFGVSFVPFRMGHKVSMFNVAMIGDRIMIGGYLMTRKEALRLAALINRECVSSAVADIDVCDLNELAYALTSPRFFEDADGTFFEVTEVDNQWFNVKTGQLAVGRLVPIRQPAAETSPPAGVVSQEPSVGTWRDRKPLL